MATAQGNSSGQGSPSLLTGMREIARREGSTFQVALEEAMRNYIESKAKEGVRPEIIAHSQTGLERNRRLAELLADL